MQKLTVLLLIMLLHTGLPGRTQTSPSPGNHVNIEKRTLANGITVLLIEDHTAPVISCQIYSRLGTRDEPADGGGSAFLIGRSALNRVDSSYREGVGLVLESDETTSAIINKDFIALLLRGSMDKLDSMVERASSFASYDSLNRDFASKQKTILDQNAAESSHISGTGESLRTFTYDRLFETAYGGDSDAHSLNGGQDTEKFTESGFLKFAAQAGAPDKLLVVIAGDFEPTYTMLLANRWFGHRQASQLPVDKKVPVDRSNVPVVSKETSQQELRSQIPIQPQPVKAAEDETPKKVETALKTSAARLDLKLPTRDDVLAIGYKVPGAENPDFPALSLLAAVLGGGQSSILTTRFMARDSVDYRASELSCRLGPYGATRMASLFAIYLREPKSPYYSIWQSENFIDSEIAKLKQKPIDPEQLITAKKLLQAEYRRRTESIDGRAFATSLGFLRTGDTRSFDNYVSAIQSVTATDLLNVANRYLIDANRAGVTIVSVPNERVGN